MLKVTVAGITLSVDKGDIRSTSKTGPTVSGLPEDYWKFLSSGSGNVVDFIVPDREVPPPNHYKHRFESSSLWKFHYNDRNDFRIEFRKGAEGVTLAFVDVDLSKGKGKIYVTEEGGKDLQGRVLPFVYPVDQVIFENILP